MKKYMKIVWLAVCMLECVMLAGCGQGIEEEVEYPVLKMMTMGNEPGQMEEIYEQLDALTEEELGIDVRISFYPWEDEQETSRRLVNSGSYDIYVYGSVFDSKELAQKGAYLDMKPYLESVPELVEFYRSQGVELLNREVVYSVPRIMNSTVNGFLYREDLRRKWNLEPVTDFTTLENYLYAAKEEYQEIAPINDKRFFGCLLELKTGSKYLDLGYGLGISWESGELVVFLDTEEYRETLETAQKWYRDGIVSEDILYLQNNNTMSTLNMMKEDKAAAEFCNQFMAVCSNYVMPLYEANPEWELGWLDYELLNDTCYYSSIITDGNFGLAISNNCKYPELAMRFLEKAHTDSRYYNLLSYGVEGIHYQLTDMGTISYEGIPAENVFRGQVGLEQDAMMLERQYPDNWDSVYRDVRERFKAMCAENGSSMIKDFHIDETDYQEYEAAMKAYSNSGILQLLQTGTIEDVQEGIREFREELDAAGYSEFVEAVNEEWKNFQGEQSDFYSSRIGVWYD